LKRSFFGFADSDAYPIQRIEGPPAASSPRELQWLKPWISGGKPYQSGGRLVDATVLRNEGGKRKFMDQFGGKMTKAAGVKSYGFIKLETSASSIDDTPYQVAARFLSVGRDELLRIACWHIRIPD
jgi:hypothetical protein